MQSVGPDLNQDWPRQLYYCIPRGGLRRNATPCPDSTKNETWAGCFA